MAQALATYTSTRILGCLESIFTGVLKNGLETTTWISQLLSAAAGLHVALLYGTVWYTCRPLGTGNVCHAQGPAQVVCHVAP